MIPKPATCSGCPLFEPPFGKRVGFSFPDGDMTAGVAVVAEALGKEEEAEGKALVGPSGHTLFQQLKRVGLERNQFKLLNVLSCRPPDNKLLGMPWYPACVQHCAPILDANLAAAREQVLRQGQTFVIVTLGNVAFERVLGFDKRRDAKLLKEDFYAYPFWSERYKAWVLNAPHPAYLVRGSTHLWPVVHFVFNRAVEIAAKGLTLDEPSYVLDPSPDGFARWAEGCLITLKQHPERPLSYDIETPYKVKNKNEEDLGKEEDADHTIIRISFSYEIEPGQTHTVSVRWSPEYLAVIEDLFAKAKFVLGWNSDQYDYPRVSRHVKVAGLGLDGMVAWHILNSSLPMGLGFVTPFYVQNTGMWKHLSDDAPAYYNAKDADMALRNWMGIKRDLVAANLWPVYERHWIRLSEATRFMSDKGVPLDQEMRDEADTKLAGILDGIEAAMEASVPKEARKVKIAKKKPKDLTGWDEITKDFPVDYCGSCGLHKPKRWKKHANLCGGPTTQLLEPQTCWSQPLEFRVSKLGLSNYQKALKHAAIQDRKTKKITFNEDALVRLIKDYPKDPLYPLILDHRKHQKLHSTYIGVRQPNGKIQGGMPIGLDGRIHTIYGRNANTLRFTSKEPNLQNLPRPKGPDDPATIIRNLIRAVDGSVLYARDYSGIEAVLTGWEAKDPLYIDLAKKDVHTYYTVYAVYELEGPKRLLASELPDLSWPKERLHASLDDLKKRFKSDRNNLYKHLVHAANFMQGAMGARDKIFSETRVEYPFKTVQKVMDIYYALFPKIRVWHTQILDEAEKEGYLRNAFGYVCRFSRPYEYKWEAGRWNKKPGPDANKAIAFRPQSTAVGIITEAILRLYFDRFEEAGQWLRLQIHDELFFEIPRPLWEAVDRVVYEEMERPIPQLRLPASWGMGDCLSILTEAKIDLNEPSRWGSMKGI